MTSMWSITDEAQASVAGYGPEEPFQVAREFVSLLLRPEAAHLLLYFVTPESRRRWGDFSEAREGLERIPDWGLASFPEPAAGAPDVAYVKILSNVPETYRVGTTTAIAVAAFLTLVWNDDGGFWMVHALGAPVRPEHIYRPNPGVAPRFTTA